MTAAFLLGIVAGWLTLMVAAALVLGAVIRLADRHTTQPASVIDPETGVVWTENKRWDSYL